MIAEVEANPIGTDAGNEWVRLFNTSDNSVDLSGWKIKSTNGKPETYTYLEALERVMLSR